jgi:hypothetical protein
MFRFITASLRRKKRLIWSPSPAALPDYAKCNQHTINQLCGQNCHEMKQFRPGTRKWSRKELWWSVITWAHAMHVINCSCVKQRQTKFITNVFVERSSTIECTYQPLPPPKTEIIYSYVWSATHTQCLSIIFWAIEIHCKYKFQASFNHRENSCSCLG